MSKWLSSYYLQQSLLIRLIIALLGTVFIICLFNRLAWIPLANKRAAMANAISIKQQASYDTKTSKDDGLNEEITAKINTLKQKIVVTPVALQAFVKTLFNTSSHLTIINVSTNIQELSSPAGVTAFKTLVTYRVSILLRGKYLAFLRYLRQLEETSMPINWLYLQYKVITYPQTRILLVLDIPIDAQYLRNDSSEKDIFVKK